MHLELSQKIVAIEPSDLAKVKRLATAYEAKGTHVIHLERGEPDFETPAHIVEATYQALRDGHTHYPNLQGEVPLREAIVRKLQRENAISAHPDEVVVTNGGMHALYALFQCLLNPGDEVLIPTPYWLSVSKLVLLSNGGVPVFVPFFMEVREKGLSPEQAVELLRQRLTPRTKVLYLNSPNNPSGLALGPEYIRAISAFCIEHNLFVIADEAYEHLTFTDEPLCFIGSLPGMAERTASVFTFSKSYAMTGYRVGYLHAPAALAKECWAKVVLYTSNGIASFLQLACVTALDGPQDCVQEMVAAYRRRKELLVGGLRELDGFEVAGADGAMYVFANIRELRAGRSIWDVIDEFLAAGVGVAPGSAFGAEYSDYVRFCYAASDAELTGCVERLRQVALRAAR